jgi:hypothetical protein
MATVTKKRHAGGRPPTIHKLTPFGEVLDPLLRQRDWSVYVLGKESGICASTIWRWMKIATKWPPADKTLAMSEALGVPLTPPMPRKAR